MLNSLKDKILISLLLLVSIVFKTLPAKYAVAVGRGIGLLVGPFMRRERTIMDAQLQFAFGKDDPRRQTVPKEVYTHIGSTLVEGFIFKKLLKTNPQTDSNGRPTFAAIETEGVETLDELLKNDQGAIALSAHIGSFELLAAFHVRYGVDLSVIGRLPNYPSLARLLARIRQSYGVQTIWRNEKGTAAKLVSAIKHKRFIAFLLDQDTSLENGFSEFFGLAAANPIVPVRLAVKYNLPVYTTFIVRTGPLKHKVMAQRINYDPKNSLAPQLILDEYNRRLEIVVSEYPGQWVWWHRRWRRRPGVPYDTTSVYPRSTKDYLAWLAEETTAKESIVNERKASHG